MNTPSVNDLLGAWDGEEIIIRRDHQTSSWIIIAIHSTRLGPATGGTRMKTYPDLAAAVDDALRLARGMTYKFAVTGLPLGGGKAVIAAPPELGPAARADLLRRYGTLIRQLGGLYRTGPDVGTSPADMDIIAETGAPYIHSRTPAAGGAGDSGPPTALGTYHAIRTTLERLFGDPSPRGRTVLIQGVGSVGARLARRLHEAGATVLVSDVDDAAAGLVRSELASESIAPGAVYDTPCDVFSPCALGGILNGQTIARLRCRGVAGSANNQLATSEDAPGLRNRGILYAPDFVVSIGGAMAITGMEAWGWSREDAERRVIETVTSTLRQVFERADTEGITTVEAAECLAGERLGS